MIHLHSWLFHPPPNSWIWVIVGRIPLLTYLWEWGHVTSKYVTQIIHHLSWSFTCFHQLSSFTIIADIFYHLVSSCVILHDFVSCLSYSIIRFHSSATRLHLVPCISCYPSFISNPSLTMMLHQRKKQGANPMVTCTPKRRPLSSTAWPSAVASGKETCPCVRHSTLAVDVCWCQMPKVESCQHNIPWAMQVNKPISTISH